MNPFSKSLALLGALGVLAVQAGNPAGNQVGNQGNAPAPQAKQDATPEAKEILQKTLAAYTSAKSYQGNWTYTLQRGNVTEKTNIEIKSKGNGRLYFHVSTGANAKPEPGSDPVPEMLIVLDGKTAYFENRTAKVFYKVPLPKNPQSSPLMFFPAIASARPVTKLPDTSAPDKNTIVLQAETTNGGLTRMEIDSAAYHIKRIVSEVTVAFVKNSSVIAVEKETFDAEIPDSQFSFKAANGSKEMAAPPGAAALFGPPG